MPELKCNAQDRWFAGGYDDWSTCTKCKGHTGNHVDDKSYTRREWAQLECKTSIKASTWAHSLLLSCVP